MLSSTEQAKEVMRVKKLAQRKKWVLGLLPKKKGGRYILTPTGEAKQNFNEGYNQCRAEILKKIQEVR